LLLYRDKEVVGVFVRFRAPLHDLTFLCTRWYLDVPSYFAIIVDLTYFSLTSYLFVYRMSSYEEGDSFVVSDRMKLAIFLRFFYGSDLSTISVHAPAVIPMLLPSW
jgi:hypothetical protein